MRWIALCVAWCGMATGAAEYALPVYSAEYRDETDPETGVALRYLTTSPAADNNLYFHEKSWLSDGTAILFTSSRPEGGLMAYLTATGELVRILGENGEPVGMATAALHGPRLYAAQGRRVLELTLRIEVAEGGETAVYAQEREICTLPDVQYSSSLNESCDGRHLSTGGRVVDGEHNPTIFVIDIASGAVQRFSGAPEGIRHDGHIQWSHTNPSLLSFAGYPTRLWVLDIRNGHTFAPYTHREGELVTHESWWVDDQILFCGGIHPYPTEDSHVKALDPHTGRVRIVGEGSWWPEGTPEALAKRNWWHADGDEQGRWIVADNWHGDIMLFEGLTVRPRLLTQGHRTYGQGAHPHVGFDRLGKQVVFTSNKLGNPDVCVATIPDAWHVENDAIGARHFGRPGEVAPE